MSALEFAPYMWHDNVIHGLRLDVGDLQAGDWRSDFVLDIGHIVGWHCPTDGPGQFQVAPAFGTRMRGGSEGTGRPGCQIQEGAGAAPFPRPRRTALRTRRLCPAGKKGGRSAREERIIAGFEEIRRFDEKHGQAPQHGEDRDIFERLYAVRLDRLRALEECRSLLAPLDHKRLLVKAETAPGGPVESMDEDELLAELAGC